MPISKSQAKRLKVQKTPKQQTEALWNDWTADDWLHAVYCSDCGLPLLNIPSESDSSTGYQMCVYCTWKSDEQVILRKKLVEIKLNLVNGRDDPLGSLDEIISNL